jgi:hypothetical protein
MKLKNEEKKKNFQVKKISKTMEILFHKRENEFIIKMLNNEKSFKILNMKWLDNENLRLIFDLFKKCKKNFGPIFIIMKEILLDNNYYFFTNEDLNFLIYLFLQNYIFFDIIIELLPFLGYLNRFNFTILDFF